MARVKLTKKGKIFNAVLFVLWVVLMGVAIVSVDYNNWVIGILCTVLLGGISILLYFLNTVEDYE